MQSLTISPNMNVKYTMMKPPSLFKPAHVTLIRISILHSLEKQTNLLYTKTVSRIQKTDPKLTPSLILRSISLTKGQL